VVTDDGTFILVVGVGVIEIGRVGLGVGGIVVVSLKLLYADTNDEKNLYTVLSIFSVNNNIYILIIYYWVLSSKKSYVEISV
jgi:hypothetical protein